MYNAEFILHVVYLVIYILLKLYMQSKSTVHIVKHIGHHLQLTMYRMKSTVKVHCLQDTVWRVQFTENSLKCTVERVENIKYSLQYTVYSSQRRAYSVEYKQ